MRILVTGGGGYIGSHTLLQLLRANHQLCVYDNFSSSDPDAVRRVEAMEKKRIKIISGDIRDEDRLDDAFLEFRPEFALHLAGKKAIHESVADPLDYYSQNVEGSIRLLEAMQRHTCRRIVFSSSASVYGNAAQIPYTEDHPRHPISPYGRTKFFTEEILRDWVLSCPGASAVVLRYFNPAGADPSGAVGGLAMRRFDNLLPHIAQVASGQREHLTIHGNDYDTIDGTGERDYIHVEDLARAHVAAVDFATCNAGFEAINLGTGRGTTVLEMVNVFQEVSGRTVRHVFGPRRPGDVGRSFTAVKKAERLLNWKSKLGLADMCRSYWHWYQKNDAQ